MIEQEYLKIAAKMLDCGVDELPQPLIIRLYRVDNLIKQVDKNHSLRSTQVIAHIVFEYQKDNLAE